MMSHADATPSCDNLPLRELIRHAWDIGRTIDLSGVGYGKAHWGDVNAVITEPFPYYFFLAGMARVLAARRVCEIGTHWGGSVKALRRGIGGAAATLVTIDISRRSDGPLAGEADIHKLVGDAGSERILAAAAERFGDEMPIDLFFLDSHHTFDATWTQYCKLTQRLRPAFAILDDIALNDDMRRVWQAVCATVAPDEALDANVVEPGIRDTGLGVVRLRSQTLR